MTDLECFVKPVWILIVYCSQQPMYSMHKTNCSWRKPCLLSLQYNVYDVVWVLLSSSTLYIVLLWEKEANYNKSKRFSLPSKRNVVISNSLKLIWVNQSSCCFTVRQTPNRSPKDWPVPRQRLKPNQEYHTVYVSWSMDRTLSTISKHWILLRIGVTYYCKTF